MDSFLAFLHNNGLLIDIIATKIGLHGSTVVLATMCYRSSVGKPLKPYDKLFSHIIIASVVAYMTGEISPYKNITYAVSFIVGLMSDTISTKLTSSSTQTEVVSTVGVALKMKFFELLKLNKERLIKNGILHDEKNNEEGTEKEGEENDEKHRNNKEEIEKRLRRKNRTSKH